MRFIALWKEFPENEELLRGDGFGADEYVTETVGKVDEEAVKKYIRQQRGTP